MKIKNDKPSEVRPKKPARTLDDYCKTAVSITAAIGTSGLTLAGSKYVFTNIYQKLSQNHTILEHCNEFSQKAIQYGSIGMGIAGAAIFSYLSFVSVYNYTRNKK